MSRAREFLRTTPICVLTIVFLCSLIYIWQTLLLTNTHQYTMCPRAVLFRHQYYRLLTAPFLHGNTLHILMNMTSYMGLGAYLEKSFGTMWHYTTILWSVCVVNLTYVFLSFLLFQSNLNKGTFNGHSLGFSGVLFHLLVIQCAMNQSSTHSVIGLFHVSSKAYPFVLLVMIQLILPNVSFMGHLSGVLAGQLHTLGYLNWFIPSSRSLRGADEWSTIRRLSSQENYIKTPCSDEFFDMTFAGRQSSSSSVFGGTNGRSILMSYGANVGNFVKDSCEKIKVKIFGRGREMNENIRLNDTEMNALLLGVGDVDDLGEEDNWVGLEYHQQKQERMEHKSEMV